MDNKEVMQYSFDKLCLPCYDELLAFAFKRTKDKARAEDVVQDSMVRALKAWDRWEPQGDPHVWARAWLFRIVANTFSNDYQRIKDFQRISSEHEREITKELVQSEQTYHPYDEPDMLGDEVTEALGRIRPEWAEVVRLVYIEGVPAPEVAKTLGIPPGTVRSRMERGRLALARILAPFARQRFGFSYPPAAPAEPELSCGRAYEVPGQFETSETEQAQADRVDGVVAEDYDSLLSVI